MSEEMNKTPQSCKQYFVYCACIVLGIIMLVIGIVMHVDRNKKSKYYVSTTGTVIDNVQGEEKSYPIYEYEVDGQLYTYKGSSLLANDQREIGARYEIKYDPEDPNKVYIDEPNNVANILVLFGSFFILGGVFFVIDRTKSIQKEKRVWITTIMASAILIGYPIAIFVLFSNLMLWANILLIICILCGFLCIGSRIYKTYFKHESLPGEKSSSNE